VNVYEIGGYTIAAESADHALEVYVEETNDLEDLSVDEPVEGETLELTIAITRLTGKQISAKTMYCCDDGSCSFCEGKDEAVLISIQDLIDRRKESEFPCVIAQEE
jgi:hypothetical protein